MAQHSVIIPCIADTYNDSATPNTSYGAASLLKMNNNNTGHTLLCFNFNDYNIKRKKIVLAKLYLFFTTIGTKTPLWFVQYPIRNKDTKETFTSADENVINFNNTENQYSTAAREYAVLPASNSWVANNITALFNMYNVHNYEGDFWFRCYYDEAGYVVHSRENTNAPYIEVVYEDVPPSKPILNEPVGIYASNSSPIRFSWGYISSVGGTQKGFSLQWSTDQDNWTTVNQTTANTYYDMPADTLPAGNIYWRVKTINEYDEESEYSDIAVFYSIGAPGVPIIQSITNNSKPVITWAADNQQVYQVQILQDDAIIHDSGDIPSIQARSYQVPIYLANGTYTVQVRIKNEYDLYSDWGETEFTINVTQPSKPILTVQRCLYGIEIHVSGTDDKTLIYRSDGSGFICIGQGEWYTDYAVASGVEYEYYARTVNSLGGFADSDIVSMRAEIKHNLFAPISNLGEIVVLKYNKDTIPAKAVTLNPMGNTAYYAGRTHAVTEYSEHEESAINFTFFTRDSETVRKLRELIRRRETVLYRDGRGRKMYGNISGYGEVDDRLGYQITFALAETDFNEEVEG